ncbi:formin-J isoform X3 [Drosophila mauritiana]|uniref:Formin-J isoform X3 n=1 Tax=Drosophila mauritiana TaxID=7226 RepID=A0A6P8JF52_DROMA|nr:formin-J isoform X3 [Drosophila mauritiana]
MNNFTTTTAAAPPKEALPRSGHVNEVCKEWLVREDGALAYKLQSQEINDFYKGNRYRNAVVREDFPTALHEQIKEKEQAQRRVDAYRRRLTEQEEHDKRVAKEIADKLERDLQEQQQKELMQSELIAKQMQEIYVNLPPVPPPVTRDKSRPPPRPAKASIHLQQQQQTQQTQSTQQQHQPEPSTSQQARYHSQLQQQQQQPLQLQQQHFSQTDNYVGLSLIPNIVDLPGAAAACTTPSRNAQAQNQLLQPPQQQQHQSSSPARRARAPTNATTSATTNMPSTSSITQHTPTHTAHPADIDELVDYADVADSIRDYNIAATSAAATSASVVDAAATSLQKQRSPSHENLLRTEPKFQKLSPEKYDQLVGNFGLGSGSVSGLGSGSGSAKAAERHMQQHADDIELYVDPCDYASLREIGLPLEEIQEMSKKLKQEQKDELLARRLQAIESKDCVRQEHRDRLLAIEAQDKELAKMLQDREKAKAKRAKEKARLRKTQQKEAAEAANGNGSLLCGTNSHCGPLLPLPPDCLSSNGNQSQADIDVEAYSNPIDVLNSSREQRPHNGPLTNGSLTRDGGSSSNHSSMQRQQRNMVPIRGEDDIYTLPVDSCRPGPRPLSLHVTEAMPPVQNHNSMTRSEHYGSEAGSHDSSHQSGQDVSPHMKYSKSGNFGIYIKVPVPRRLTCQFKVLEDQIQVKIVKRSPRTSARISEP